MRRCCWGRFDNCFGMIKICIFFSFVFLFSSQVFCQDSVYGDEKHYYNIAKYYNINNIEYVLFSRYPDYLINETYPEYTKITSIDKVLKVDSLAYEYVKKQKHMPGQGYNDCPIIKDNWENYGRQVICYLEKKGKRKYDEIIQINYIHNSEIAQLKKDYDLYGFDSNWKETWLYVSGGCSFYFHIYYNVNKGKIVDFVVN